MDIRIVNTCNNNCKYCLEQNLRSKDKFISPFFLSEKINNNRDNYITFYWWNPILHPKINQIIRLSKKSWKNNIWILSNSYWLDKEKLKQIIESGLNNFWFYFYSFDTKIHNFYSGGSLEVRELCKNIQILQKSGIYIKAIIHIHNGNIRTIAKDIYYLNSKFWIKNFEFIHYNIVDRAVDFQEYLKYNISENRENIDKLFQEIKRLNLSVKFVRFEQEFYWNNTEYL